MQGTRSMRGGAMTARTRLGRLVVVATLAVGGLGALAAPAPAQVPGKNSTNLAFTRVVSGNGDVWVMKPDGSVKKNLTKTPEGDERYGAISPAGGWVVFIRNGGLYRTSDTGGQQPQPIPMFGDLGLWV